MKLALLPVNEDRDIVAVAFLIAIAPPLKEVLLLNIALVMETLPIANIAPPPFDSTTEAGC